MAKKKAGRANHGVANNTGTAEGMMAHAMKDTKGAVRKAAGKKRK